jgi:hypothetical protein
MSSGQSRKGRKKEVGGVGDGKIADGGENKYVDVESLHVT